MPASYAEVIVDDSFVFKFYFLFGRMDIDINFIGIDIEEKNIERVLVRR